MLVRIQSQPPSWWDSRLDNFEKPRTLSEWWNGLEWQEYKVPDLTDSCNRGDPTGLVPDDPVGFFKESLCHADHITYTLAHYFPGDWYYKMAANAGMHVRMGIDNEIDNVINLVRSWIGL